jgi:hypothetical protein
MIDVNKMIDEILKASSEVVNCYGQHMDQGDFADIAKDTTSQITKAIIQEHQMISLENDHPAIKDLREKLNVMTSLLNTKETK